MYYSAAEDNIAKKPLYFVALDDLKHFFCQYLWLFVWLWQKRVLKNPPAGFFTKTEWCLVQKAARFTWRRTHGGWRTFGCFARKLRTTLMPGALLRRLDKHFKQMFMLFPYIHGLVYFWLQTSRFSLILFEAWSVQFDMISTTGLMFWRKTTCFSPDRVHWPTSSDWKETLYVEALNLNFSQREIKDGWIDPDFPHSPQSLGETVLATQEQEMSGLQVVRLCCTGCDFLMFKIKCLPKHGYRKFSAVNRGQSYIVILLILKLTVCKWVFATLSCSSCP